MRRFAARSALLLGLLPVAAMSQAPAPSAPPPAPAPAVSTAPLPGREDFISPVGEPYHSPDKLSGAEHWFQETDTDHDGRVSYAEYLANAERFFTRLDVNHDGEIDPQEIERYETEIAPEIRVVSTGFDYVPTGDDDSTPKIPYPDRLGAGRYSYIDLPEPILAMDTNFDRGVTHKEFVAAARKRFVALDTNGDGFLIRTELPKIVVPKDEFHHNNSGGGGKHRGGRGGHGGMGGGGMGGMGGGAGMGGSGMDGSGMGGAGPRI